MTVDDLIDWLNQKKALAAESGQDISNYKICVPRNDYDYELFDPVEDGKVDHGKDTIYFWSD